MFSESSELLLSEKDRVDCLRLPEIEAEKMPSKS